MSCNCEFGGDKTKQNDAEKTSRLRWQLTSSIMNLEYDCLFQRHYNLICEYKALYLLSMVCVASTSMDVRLVIYLFRDMKC